MSPKTVTAGGLNVAMRHYWAGLWSGPDNFVFAQPHSPATTQRYPACSAQSVSAKGTASASLAAGAAAAESDAPGGLRRYLKQGDRILRFMMLWEDLRLHGGKQVLNLNVYLKDNTMEVS